MVDLPDPLAEYLETAAGAGLAVPVGISRISLLSYFAKGSSIGTEPAAMMMCLPVISATLPS